MPERQQKLGGAITGPSIKEIDDKAEELYKVRRQRMALGKKEEELQGELLDILKKHGFKGKKKYMFDLEEDGEEVKLDVLIERPGERAYVRKHKEPKAETDGEAEEPEEE